VDGRQGREARGVAEANSLSCKLLRGHTEWVEKKCRNMLDPVWGHEYDARPRLTGARRSSQTRSRGHRALPEPSGPGTQGL
jgi:hypothetical protein